MKDSQQMVEDEVLVNDAIKIVEEGEKHNVVLRLLGALAIRIHSAGYEELHKKLDRLGVREKSFTDIDFMAYSKQRAKIRQFMEDVLNFQISRQFLLMHGKERLIYYHPKELYHIDVFFDKLRFNHDIYFGNDPKKGRLRLDFPTIPLSDLLLEKIQIHNITEKDIKDIIVLLRAHETSQVDEKESINCKYIAEILADDWGFWHDAKVNLGKVKTFAEDYCKIGLLMHEDLANMYEKVDKVIAFIDDEPKTRKWMKRAEKGTSKKWWESVETVVR